MDSKSSRGLLLRWLLAGGCFAALIFFFSPCWGAFRLWARVPEMQGMLEVRRGASVLQQIEHPGAAIADPLHRVIQWRLLFPLLGRGLHLPPPLFFSLAHLGCLLVLAYLVTLLRRHGLGWLETGLAAVMLGAASWFFTSTGWLGYFDSWLALALLLVAFAEGRWAVWLACLAPPWVDERFVLAAPLALLCRFFRPADREGATFDWRSEIAVPAALLAAFAGIHLGVLTGHSAADATPLGHFRGRDFLDAPPARIALGVGEGLRAGWVLVVTAVVLLWPRRRRALALTAAALAVIIVGLATAQDYSRSMTMLLPAAVLGALLAVKTSARWRPVILRAGAVGALLLPAHHVMNDRVNPIFYLYHELAAFDSPPATAMPELYELRAIHAMERGEFTRAESDLTLAIKLADNPSSPARQRGILYASGGRWAEALKDFSKALEYDAQDPDAWFMRAQANLAVGNAAAARSDLSRAIELAPDNWSKRPDVARFPATLRQKSGAP